MTIVTLVSGCGNAYPGDGTRDDGGQGGRWVSSTPTRPGAARSWIEASDRMPRRRRPGPLAPARPQPAVRRLVPAIEGQLRPRQASPGRGFPSTGAGRSATCTATKSSTPAFRRRSGPSSTTRAASTITRSSPIGPARLRAGSKTKRMSATRSNSCGSTTSGWQKASILGKKQAPDAVYAMSSGIHIGLRR